jgi:iron complex outermembrane receptor protein
VSTYFSAAVNRLNSRILLVQMIMGNQPTYRMRNVGVDLSTTSGHTAFSKVGAMPLNDQNSKYTQAYSL